MTTLNELADNVLQMIAEGATDEVLSEYLTGLEVNPEQVAIAIKARRAGVDLPDPGIFRQLAQGVSLGFADEIEASISAAAGDITYDDARDIVRLGNQLYRSENPWKAGLAELAGGALTGGAGMLRGAGSVAARNAAGRLAGNSMIPGLAKGAGIGAAEGGVAGYGINENPDQLGSDIAKGAGFGAGLNPAFQIAGKGVKSIWNRFRSDPVEEAERVLAQSLGGDEFSEQAAQATDQALSDSATRTAAGLPPAPTPMTIQEAQRQAAAQQAQDVAQGVPSEQSLLEIGGAPVQRTVRGARSADARANELIDERLNRRYYYDERPGGTGGQGQYGRIDQALRSASGEPAVDPRLNLEQRVSQRSANADANYGPIMDTPVPVADIIDTLRLPHFTESYAVAQRLARLRGEDLPTLEELAKLDTVPLRVIDQIKQGVDTYLSGETGRGLARYEKRLVRERLNDLLDVAETAEDGYAAARRQFAGESSEIAAGERGLEFRSISAADMRRELSQMTPGELAEFRISAREQVMEQLGKGTDSTDLVKRLDGSPELRQKLRMLLGDDAYEQFSQRLGLERQQVVARNAVKGGSNTVDKAVDLASVVEPMAAATTIVNNAAQAGSSPWRTAFRAADRGLTKYGGGNRGPRMERIARMATETDPAAIQSTLAQLVRRGELDAVEAQKLLRQLQMVGSAGTVGTQAAFDEPGITTIHINRGAEAFQ